jgi:hypothetical protein
MKRWEVYTDTYEVVEPVLDDGSGPMVPVVDWVEVEAPDWRTAMKLGREKLEAEFGRWGWIGQRRQDGLFPFTGVHCCQLHETPERALVPDVFYRILEGGLQRPHKAALLQRSTPIAVEIAGVEDSRRICQRQTCSDLVGRAGLEPTTPCASCNHISIETGRG